MRGGEKFVIGGLGDGLFKGDQTLKKITLAPNVSNLEYSCFNGCSSLTAIENTQNVTSVSSSCFAGCKGLTSIDLTSCTTIGYGAFENCTNLETVNLTVCKSIGNDAFYKCSKLKSINTSTCESLGFAFRYCNSLEEVDLSNCSNIGEAGENYAGCFEQCFKLRTIGRTAKLTQIPGSTFNDCSSLESIDLSNCKSIGQSAFNGCKKLKGVNLSKCTYIGNNAFSSCESIENVDLSSATNIENWAFSNCYSLKSVVWPSKLTSIPDYTFQNDSTLTDIDLSKATSIGYCAFAGCKSLNLSSLPNCTKIGSSAFRNCTAIETVTLPLCESILEETFYGCSNLKDASLQKCNSIKDQAFAQCSSLTKINIPLCSKLGKAAFMGCKSLEIVELPVCDSIADGRMESGYYGDKYEQWYTGTFSNCTSLKSINLPICKYIGSYAFANDSTMTEINTPACDSISNYAFYNCKSIKTINFPLCKKMGDKTFSGCSAIETISLPVCEAINTEAFNNCKNLKEVDLPKCKSIGSRAFASCTNLTKINLPVCEIISNYAFYDCHSIQTITFPLCKIIGEQAFMSCTNLTKIDLALCDSIGSEAFNGCSALENVTLPACTSLADASYYSYRNNSGVFGNCSNLKSISLPICKYIGSYAFENDGLLTKVEAPMCDSISNYAFSNCQSIQTISLPHCKKIGENSFINCSSIETINLPVCEAIPNNAFYSCQNIKEVDLPKCKSIGEQTFEACTSLKNISLPLCENIDQRGFYGCSALKTIALPACKAIGKSAFGENTQLYLIEVPIIESIGSCAFSGCPSLEECALPETLKTIGTNAFDGNTVLTITATTPPTYKQEEGVGYSQPVGDMVMVKVPSASISAYRSAEGWKNVKGHIFGIDDSFDYDITTNAVATTSGIVNVIGEDNLQKVVSLKVKGSINGYDIMVMRNKMDNLHYLDLADANVIANDNGYQYYEGASLPYDNVIGQKAFYKLYKLVTVKLPNTVRFIQRSAFAECHGLKSIELPKELIRIEDGYDDWTVNNYIPGGAFENCSNLQNVKFNDKLTYVGRQTFRSCPSLKDLNLSCELDTIGGYAFQNCYSLDTIILPAKLKTISEYAFEGCYQLTHVEFPPSLKNIETAAFRNSGLKDISLPGLENISENAFNNCRSLNEIKIPSTLRGIGQSAFEDCNDIEKVYSYTVEPINIGQNTFSCFDVATLYVPEQAKYNYYWETKWSQFKEIKTFNEPYSFFYVNKKYTLSEGARYDGCPNIEIGAEGEIGVEGSTMQDAGDIHIKGDGKDAGSLIASGNVNANNIYFDITINANRWYFFSFPFDIKRSDIQMKGSSVWRTYNGELRAQGNSGWTNLPASEEWLHRGQGYIFQASVSGTLTIKVDKSKFGNLIAETIQNKLQKHDASNSYDASWNFTGNPFTSYYDMNDLGYNAPITYWDENAYSYVAVRPGDDDYVFHPFQAFFVQKPQGVDAMEFNPDHRQGKPDDDGNQSMKAKRSSAITRGIDAKRLFINMKLSNGTNEDKTRIVFNEDKSEKYELDCDAAKFENGTEVVELYSIGSDNTRYAINERPKGDVKLGFKTTQKGTFTLGVERMDLPMILKDNLMNVTFDLSSGDYSFTSEKGTFNDRFTLTTSGTATGIADIMQQTGVSIIPIQGGINIKGLDGTKTVHIYSLNGTLLAEISNDGFVSLAQNVYVVKCEAYKAKLMVR